MYKQLDATLKGVAPLLMHSGNLANPLHPLSRALKSVTGKRGKSEDDHGLLGKIEWLGSLYASEAFEVELAGNDVKVTGGGVPVLPGGNVESALIDAAKTRKQGPAAKAGLIVDGHFPLKFKGPKTIAGLLEDPNFVDVRRVRVGTASVMRTRPIFHDWSVDIRIHYLPSMLDRDQVLELLQIAGQVRGLCDYRPRHGRFIVA